MGIIMEMEIIVNRFITKKTFTIIYIVLISLLIWSSFLSGDSNYIKVRERAIPFEREWIINGAKASLPYNEELEFKASAILPNVSNNDYLILKCRYDEVTVYIEDEEIFTTSDSYYMAHKTNAGNKELIIPMKRFYTGKIITLDVKLHKSLYKASFSNSFLISGGDYVYRIVMDNLYVIILSILFLTSGFIEVLLSGYFVAYKIKSRRKYSYEAILYGGLFSIVASVWCICYTRLPAVLFGNMVVPSIIGYICFLLMPLTFIGMIRALDDHDHRFIDRIMRVCAIIIMVEYILNILGIMDWAQTTLSCHIMDGLAIISAIIVAIKLRNDTDNIGERRILYVGNTVFATIALISIFFYARNRETGFMQYFIVALLFYICTLIIYVFKRIGLNAEEAHDYEVTQIYAYTDELTGLGNRRQYWATIDSIKNEEAVEDLTVIYMDVNRLKTVNDKLGHDAGDEMLIGATNCINSVFTNAVKCRMGGDEFALILNISEKELDKKLAEFRRLVRSWRGNTVRELSIAIGTASLRENRSYTLEEICSLADDRMYEDKKRYYEENGLIQRS